MWGEPDLARLKRQIEARAGTAARLDYEDNWEFRA
jgi:hypothetical protein